MTSDPIVLAEGETLVANGEELVYRQVTQHMLTEDGQLGSPAFSPSTSDAGKLSLTRSSLVSAQDARDWHTRNARSKSLGVRGVTVTEVGLAERVVIDDSGVALTEGEKRSPGHCYVDFAGLDKTGRKNVAAILLRFANARGEINTTETTEDGELFPLEQAS